MQFVKQFLSWRGLLVLASLAMLSACVVVEEGPRPRPIPIEDGPIDNGPIGNGPIDGGPRFCTREYDPVCAVDRGSRRTFGNACEARNAGYRIISGGECRRGRPERPRPEQTSMCTREYDPVCARRGGEIRTFGNACEAREAEYRIVGRGPC
ncbi:MAG TPA: Kazal-type serine protease inhibitor [Mesorhizobium sp.]